MIGVRVLGDHRVSVDEFPVPEPPLGDVRIKIRGAGVCGSDLFHFRSTPEQIGERNKLVTGHEPAGVVDAVGDGVEGLEVGDRVAVYHVAACGHCRECKRLRPQYCGNSRIMGLTVNGSDAEYMLAPAHHCHRLPDNISFEDGALAACIGGTAWSALRQQNVSATDTVGIYGLGPVGLAAVLLAKSLGARVIGTEPSRPRRELAERLGVDVTIDPTTGDAVEAVLEASDGGLLKAIEVSGNPMSRANAVHQAAPLGSVAYVGVGAPAFEVDAWVLIDRQLKLIGSWIFEPPELDELLAYMSQRNLSFDPFITHRFPLTEAQRAYELADTREVGRVMFTFDEPLR